MTKRTLEDAPVTGALAERQLPDGRRMIKLRTRERQALVRQQQAEAAAALFLDLDQGHTWAEIAEQLDMSTAQLKELTKTAEFDNAYNALFADLGHDPRYRAAQGALSDMLPLAIRELKTLITSNGVASGVRLRAIQTILKLNGVTEPETQHSDRNEMVRFLVEHKIDLQNVGIPVPGEYSEAYGHLTADIVEGEVTDIGTETEDSPDSDPTEDTASQS